MSRGGLGTAGVGQPTVAAGAKHLAAVLIIRTAMAGVLVHLSLRWAAGSRHPPRLVRLARTPHTIH